VIQANRECGINLHSTQIKAYHTFKESEDSMIFNQHVISDDEESNGKEDTRQSGWEESMKLELANCANSNSTDGKGQTQSKLQQSLKMKRTQQSWRILQQNS
jgi:hypothetical protein